MSVRVSNPYPVFLDTLGYVLDGGKVYVGTENLDPEVSPLTVYIDAALTTPIPQPIQVISGLLTYNGNPVQIYVSAGAYSLRTRDIDGAEVFYAPSSAVSSASYQPLDADLTTISAATNTAFGLALLTKVDGAAVRSYIGVTEPTNPTESLILAVSDEVTALTAGAGKLTFRMPYAFTISEVRASLTVAQTSGSIFTVDINEAGTSILSTKLTVDNGEKTSLTAAGAPVLVDVTVANDAEMSIDIDQVGDGTAKGLKVVLIGARS